MSNDIDYAKEVMDLLQTDRQLLEYASGIADRVSALETRPVRYQAESTGESPLPAPQTTVNELARIGRQLLMVFKQIQPALDALTGAVQDINDTIADKELTITIPKRRRTILKDAEGEPIGTEEEDV